MLTVPELAFLFAHTKIMVYDALLDSDVPEDRYLAHELRRYFPTPLRERFAARMHAHPLRREIIASSVANEVVNRLDFTATFTVADYMVRRSRRSPAPSRSSARSWGCGGCGPTSRPWTVAIPMAVQTEMVDDIGRVLTSLMRWLLHHRRPPIDVEAEVSRFGDQLTKLAPVLRTLRASRPQACELRAHFVGERAGRARRRGRVARRGHDRTRRDRGRSGGRRDRRERGCGAGGPVRSAAARLAAPADGRPGVRDPMGDAVQARGAGRAVRPPSSAHRRRAPLGAPGRAPRPGSTPGWPPAAATARFERLLAEIEKGGTFDVTTLTVALSELRNLVPNERPG